MELGSTMKRGYPVVMVPLRYARSYQIEWHVRIFHGATDMDEHLGKNAYKARLENIHGGRDNLPKDIEVHEDLVVRNDGGFDGDFGQAPDDQSKWPTKGREYPEEGYDEQGNEYWMICEFKGDNPFAPGACVGTKSGSPPSKRFSIDGLELILIKDKPVCIHGRFVKHIKEKSAYQFAAAVRQNVGGGMNEEVTPTDEEGKAKLEEMSRFGLEVLGCAGPVKEVYEDENGQVKERMLLPSRKAVLNKGMEYNQDKFKRVLVKVAEVANVRQELEDELTKKKAAEIIGKQMAEAALTKQAEEIKNQILAEHMAKQAAQAEIAKAEEKMRDGSLDAGVIDDGPGDGVIDDGPDGEDEPDAK